MIAQSQQNRVELVTIPGFLQRLLFVHGAWNHIRISNVVLYTLYKNIVLYIIQLYYAAYNNWTGTILFDQWTINFYNLIFTALPPMALGLFDKICSDETRERNPRLYKATQSGSYFTVKAFGMWMANALLHSVICFWMCKEAYGQSNQWPNGRSSGRFVLGTTTYTCALLTVIMRAALQFSTLSWPVHTAIWGSIAAWFIFIITHSYSWPVLGFTSDFFKNLADFSGMIEILGSTPDFYLLIMLVPITALITDVFYKAVKTTVCPDEIDRAIFQEQYYHSRAKRCPQVWPLTQFFSVRFL